MRPGNSPVLTVGNTGKLSPQLVYAEDRVAAAAVKGRHNKKSLPLCS
jgi:hypothetical protein